MFDIFITTAEKDYNKLRFVCDSILRNIKDYGEIYIVSPTAIPDEECYIDAHYMTDREIFDFDFSKINMESRRGWYRQQFIKLLQKVTIDNYLVIDSDVYINHKINVNPKMPSFYLGKDQFHKPYFRFMKDVFKLDRAYPHSFISEIMLFKRELIWFMINSLKLPSINDFFNICVEEINKIGDASSFSEYELYGNYVTSIMGSYSYQKVEVLHNSKKREWTQDEMKELVRANRKSKYDILTMHSWI